MSKIYVNQTALRIQLNVGVPIVGAQSLKIRYLKPGVTQYEEFTASELVGTPKTLYYDFQSGDLSVAGEWIFWAYVTFADGRSAPGESVKVRVWEEGT